MNRLTETVRIDDTGRFVASYKHGLPSAGDTIVIEDETYEVVRTHWTAIGIEFQPIVRVQKRDV